MADKEASLLLRIKTAGEESLSKVGDLLSELGKIGATAFGFLTAAVIKSIAEYSKQEEAVNSLTRTMVNNGIYSRELKDAYLAQADALAKVTLFGDEQIIAAQSAFSQQARGIKLTEQATKSILDFAQAQGIDASSAAELIGKSVGTSTNALARYGIEVNATASKAEKMTQVLTGLSAKFGGQAEAATSGLGALKLLSKSVGELFEAFGGKLAPIISGISTAINNFVNDSKQIEPVMNSAKDVFIFLLKAGASVQEMFVVLGKTIGTVFAGSIESVSQAMQGNFTNAKNVIVDAVKEIGAVTVQSAIDLTDKIKTIDDLSIENTKLKHATEEQLLRDSLARKSQIVIEDSLANQERDLTNLIAQSDLNSQMEMALLSQKHSAIYAADAAAADRRYQLATTQADKTKALADKYRATELGNQAKYDEVRIENTKSTLQTISSLSKSNNSVLAALGKASALTQIAIDTPVAISKALAAAPPPFNFLLAAGVGAAMAQQAAQVAGIQMAEGGIVMPRPGGTQATIGEAGQAEAVIPLDRFSEFGVGGGGTNITLVVNGGMMGSETEAREFAIAIDRELLKLRRNNESVSFDSGVI